MLARFAAQPSPFADYEVRLCELVRDPAELEDRIAARVHAMLQAGLVLSVAEVYGELDSPDVTQDLALILRSVEDVVSLCSSS